ncbi:MAG TPA: fumarylacetoacetate hydrolase family protein [Pseudogracilibacillus sp.]|nr:fumarylacetoacetate hydrolase family protein [Pseudogracilibacillus sp.]
MKHIKNIYCIGRNYADHVKELNNKMPEQPLIFSKPTHALVKAEDNQIILPSNKGEVHHEVEIVLEIDRDYEAGLGVDDLVSKMYIGLDLTLRDEQQKLKEAGLPWLLSKGFKNAAIISKAVEFPTESVLREKEFSLKINETVVQAGKINQMTFSLDAMIQYLANHVGLKKGDLIFTGTPAGVGPLKNNDRLELNYDGKIISRCEICR